MISLSGKYHLMIIIGGYMEKLDKTNRMPLYFQLMDVIIDSIERGNYKADDQLPSERELCDTYEISRSTVRQAIQELEKEGYIYRIQGKGTFISPEKFKQSLFDFYSFTEEMKKLGKTPKSKVLDFEIIEADGKISEKTDVSIGEKVYVFTRLRLADNEPMMVETSYVPYKKFPNITRQQLEEEALYDIFNNTYHVNITSAEEIFQSVLTNESEALILEYKDRMPSMMIERITYSNSAIIEYTKSIARGDRFKYSVILNK